MYGVWERILPIADAGRAQNLAYGRISPQVPGMQQELQPKIELEDAPANAQRREQASPRAFGRMPGGFLNESVRELFTRPFAQAFTSPATTSPAPEPAPVASRRPQKNARLLNRRHHETLIPVNILSRYKVPVQIGKRLTLNSGIYFS